MTTYSLVVMKYSVKIKSDDDKLIDMLSSSTLENAIAFASYLFVNSKQNLLVVDDNNNAVVIYTHF